MRTVFLVPRRADGGHRDKVWAWCRRRWETLFPDVPIYEGHHDEGLFNRSAAINNAARAADADGHWDLAIVIDSDVLLPLTQVRAAINVRTFGTPDPLNREDMIQPGWREWTVSVRAARRLRTWSTWTLEQKREARKAAKA